MENRQASYGMYDVVYIDNYATLVVSCMILWALHPAVFRTPLQRETTITGAQF